MNSKLYLLAILCIVQFALAGCNDEDEDTVGISHSAIIKGEVQAPETDDENTVPKTDELSIMLFWAVDSYHGYIPEVASLQGDYPSSFQLNITEAPPMNHRFALEDPVTGEQTDPDAPMLARASLYLVSNKAIEAEDYKGIAAYDIDIVFGMVPGVTLIYSPVYLDSTAGVRGLNPKDSDAPVHEGYSLWRDGEEIPIDTNLQAVFGFVADFY